MLKVDRVEVFYGKSQVLHGASLDVAPGEVVAVLGRNGMGKTTLVHSIVGFLRPTAGTIELDGHPLHGRSPEAIFRRGVTLMPQGHRVFGSLTVGENLTVAARPNNSGGWTIDEVTAYFPRLAERWKQPSYTLSGGEQQMLTMARTLVGNGRFVLLDEPAEGLAPAITALFATVIQELRSRGAGVLLVEQRLDFALNLADRLSVMSRGIEVFSGTPADLERASEIKARYLGM